MQKILVAVVSIGWLSVLLVPAITPLEISAQLQIGVQAAMMLVLGAVFGVQIIRKHNGERQ